MIEGTKEQVDRQCREWREFAKTHDLVWSGNIGRWLPRKMPLEASRKPADAFK